MIKVIPFEPEHILGMDLLIQDDFIKDAINNLTYLRSLKKCGPAYSGFTSDGKCIGAAGIRQINFKTFEGWAVLSKESNKYIKSIMRAIDLFIYNYFKFDAADRFQATVRLDYIKGHRFAKLLKFKPEGILKNYEAGVDYMMYARVNSWL